MIALVSENDSCVVRRQDLVDSDRDQMFQLLSAHFEGVTANQFEQDLAGKSHVILIRQGSRLVGFSTLLAYETSFKEQTVNIIYSGDTIVAPEAWRSTTLFRTWIRCVNQLKAGLAHGDCYWLLLTSGFRTYRLLPLFWKEFFPRFDKITPQETGELLHHLCTQQFGRQFNGADGIVRFSRPQRLRERLREVPAGRQANPDIAYFLSRNPRHAAGDELVCLTKLCEENLTMAGRRMVGQK